MGVRGSRQKQGVQSTLLLVPPNSTAFRRGTGRSICHAKRFGDAKHPLTCAAQLNCVSSRHGKIYLPRQKVRGAKHPLTCAAQLNCVSSRHGKIHLPRQKVRGAKHPFHCTATAVAEAMAGQAASQARLPYGGILFAIYETMQRSLATHRSLFYSWFGPFGRKGSSQSSQSSHKRAVAAYFV